MKMGWARALLLAAAAMAACSKSGSGDTGDAGPHGPTNLTVKWVFSGKPASASECSAHEALQVFVTLSATLDPELHQTITADCDKGSVSLGSPLVENLGQPFVEAALLDDKGVTVAVASANVTPVPGSTTVTLDFFPVMGTGGAGGMMSSSSSAASSAASTAAASSSGGMGGAGGMMSSSSTGAGGGTTGAGGGDAG
ncbi:MAG: hypothetical protein QM820_28520 [Minicystis sp.]